MSVTLINVFAVPGNQRDEFLKCWTQTSQVYARTEGFVETHLHENTGVGSATFQFINFAIWASNEAFIQAHKDYVPEEESIPGVSFHPAIFAEVIMIKNLLSTHSEGGE